MRRIDEAINETIKQDLRVFFRASCLFGMVSMLTKDLLGPYQVRGLDPDLGRETLKLAKASFQVVAEHLASLNSLLFEPTCCQMWA